MNFYKGLAMSKSSPVEECLQGSCIPTVTRFVIYLHKLTLREINIT